MSIDKKRYDYSTLPKSWARDDLSRKPSMSTKLDMGFYNPELLQKYDPKPQSFLRGSINPGLIPDSIDLTAHDYSTTGKNASSSSSAQNVPRSRTSSSKKSSRSNPYDYSRGIRNDASLVPPIRQTASIFKQPVTLYKMQESKVKTDFKHGSQEKPKQLFWEKRLEGLKATDMFGDEIKSMILPKSFVRPVGPNISDETILQSMATALHVLTQPLTGQLGNKTSLEKNPGVFLNPEQPLVQAINLCEDDIKRQEERVTMARKKLEEAMKSYLG